MVLCGSRERVYSFFCYQACESVRGVLEECNVDADIDLFVRDKATGSERPREILYENYYHPTQTTGTLLGGSGVKVGGAFSLADHPHKESRPLPPEPLEEPAGVDCELCCPAG